MSGGDLGQKNALSAHFLAFPTGRNSKNFSEWGDRPQPPPINPPVQTWRVSVENKFNSSEENVTDL
jgi:hypothetical protein